MMDVLKNLIVHVFDFLLKYNAVLFAGILAACVSIYGHAVIERNSKRAVIAEAITKNRMAWIEEVRNLLSDFIAAYMQGDRNDETRLLKARIELYCSDGGEYSPMLESLHACCQDPGFDEKHCQALVESAQKVLNRVWIRIKAEGGITKKKEERIIKETDELLALKSDEVSIDDEAYSDEHIFVKSF